MGFLGKLFVGFLIVIVVLAVVGFWMKKRNGEKLADEKEAQKAFDNAVDLNDRFIRARYMDKENEQGGAE